MFCFPQDDVQLWLSHVAFCRKWVCGILLAFVKTIVLLIEIHISIYCCCCFFKATKTQLSKVFSTMLAIHSDKPGTDNCRESVFSLCGNLHWYSLQ